MVTQFREQNLTPEATLTAAGNSSAVDVREVYNHSVAIVADYEDAGDDNITIALQGSIDGTNYFTVPLKNTTVAGLTISNHQGVIDTPGNYVLQAEAKVKFLRLRLASLSATTAGLSVRWFGGN